MPDRNTVLEERESIALFLCMSESMQQANASDNVCPSLGKRERSYSLGFTQGYVIRFKAVTILHSLLCHNIESGRQRGYWLVTFLK